MSEELSAPDVDLSQPIYADTPESQVIPGTAPDFSEDMETSDWPDQLENQNLNERLKRIEDRIDALASGVNTIGEMMNGVADAFAQIMQQVQEKGIGGLLGGLMGGKKDG